MQTEFKRREEFGNRFSGVSGFATKIKWGQCGGWYGSKVWHSNDKYRKVIYSCNDKFSKDVKCTTPHITEQELKNAAVIAINKKLNKTTPLQISQG